jgi:nucleoside-diphosphate kinase
VRILVRITSGPVVAMVWEGDGVIAAETAAFEIGLWFQPSELSDWTPADQGWRSEG